MVKKTLDNITIVMVTFKNLKKFLKFQKREK